jgi:O-antigen/teichoic acid export membrane protein
LVIFPIAAYLLNKEEFGRFIFSLGIVMVIGMAPSGGLSTGVIRHLADFDGRTKDLFVSTGLRLCKIVMMVILLVGFVVLAILRFFGLADPKIIQCLVPLLIMLYSWNLFEYQMVRYRIERKFALRTAWYSFLSALLFIAIPAVILGGSIGMCWGYMFGFVVTHIILFWRRKILFRKSDYDAKLAVLLKKIWLHMSLASVLELSSRYIYRIILGIFYSYSSVTVFFGATNIIDLCMSPMGIWGRLLLSMLSGFSRLEDVGKRQRYTVLMGAISIAVGATLAVLFFGKFVLSVMFPKFANESVEILRLLVIVIPFVAVVLFSRPFVVKFGPIKFTPVLNGLTFIGHIVPAVILISKFGLKGAAISYDIGYGISAISYLVALVWTFKLSRKNDMKLRQGSVLDRIEGHYENRTDLTINEGFEKW